MVRARKEDITQQMDNQGNGHEANPKDRFGIKWIRRWKTEDLMKEVGMAKKSGESVTYTP